MPSQSETAANCLGILERGLRRFGISDAPRIRPLRLPVALPAPRPRAGSARVAALPRRTQLDVPRVLALARAGHEQSEIGRLCGCSQSYVSKIVKASRSPL